MSASTHAAAFRDRQEAGQALAARLERFRRATPVVLALSRGGVFVAAEVASALAAPLGVLAVHPVGYPGRHVGGVSEDGVAVIDHDEACALGIDADELATLRERAAAAARDAGRRLRAGRALPELVGRTVVLIDEGVISGACASAAARSVRRRGAARIVLAVPVAPGCGADAPGRDDRRDRLRRGRAAVALVRPDPRGVRRRGRGAARRVFTHGSGGRARRDRARGRRRDRPPDPPGPRIRHRDRCPGRSLGARCRRRASARGARHGTPAARGVRPGRSGRGRACRGRRPGSCRRRRAIPCTPPQAPC